MMTPLLTVMVAAVRKASRAINRDFGEVENLQVSLKGPGNFVTKSDHRAEKVLCEELAKARPGFSFLTEETGVIKGSDPTQRWIIDPIDGTTNFAHGIGHFALSVALEKAGDLVAGVVYNPISDELFMAEKGRGAYINNRRLRVSRRKVLSQCVVACGIPHHGQGDAPLFRKELEAIQGSVAGVRRFGAASLDLAYVAAGRLDGYWEHGLSPWDMAAGILLVQEAGGQVGDFLGSSSPLQTGRILATNAELWSPMQKLLTAAGSAQRL